MTPAVPARDVWSDLVGGLLDARTDPATARFDAELAAGLADGSLTEDAAHRLRFWQRASVRSLADHARTVLPVALGALEAARHEAESDVAEAADVLGEPEPAPAGQHPEPPSQQPEPPSSSRADGRRQRRGGRPARLSPAAAGNQHPGRATAPARRRPDDRPRQPRPCPP